VLIREIRVKYFRFLILGVPFGGWLLKGLKRGDAKTAENRRDDFSLSRHSAFFAPLRLVFQRVARRSTGAMILMLLCLANLLRVGHPRSVEAAATNEGAEQEQGFDTD